MIAALRGAGLNVDVLAGSSASPHEVADPDGHLAAALPQPDAGALVEACRAIVADGSWRRRGEEAHERVRGWSMADAVARALDEVSSR